MIGLVLVFSSLQVNAYSGNFTHKNPNGTVGVYNKTEVCVNEQTKVPCMAAFEAVEKTVNILNDLQSHASDVPVVSNQTEVNDLLQSFRDGTYQYNKTWLNEWIKENGCNCTEEYMEKAARIWIH